MFIYIYYRIYMFMYNIPKHIYMHTYTHISLELIYHRLKTSNKGKVLFI